jgi:hypothetical protein
MEILTNILRKEQFRQELADITVFLAERGVRGAAVSFGFAPDYPDLDDVGVRYVVPISDVCSFIAERERTKAFPLGESDCWIEPSALDARFLFCNDRDVHLTSESAELLDSVRAHWREKGFNVYPDDLDENA